MPSPGVIAVKNYSSSLDQRLLSPAVWAYCPAVDMSSNFQGFFVDTSFENGLINLPSSADTNGTVTGPSTYASTVFIPGDHVVKLTSGSTSGGSYASIHTCPIGPVVPGGLGFWFEASVLPGSSTAANGLFVGATVAAGLYGQLLSTAGSKTPSTGLPLFGFILNSTSTNMDAVYASSGGALQTVTSNVLNTSTLTGNPGNLQQSPSTPPGTFYNSTATAVKFGLEYQPGSNNLNWYVNGALVGQIQPTSAIFDTTDDFGGIVTVGGGSGNVAYCDFLAVASQLAK